MNEKEQKILFLQTKLENESKKLNSDDFFKLISHKIGWKEYHSIYSDFVNNSLLDTKTHTKLTDLGKNTLNVLISERQQEIKDENAERKKLHNESVMSGWKRKTFWYIFAFGLFGGIYSGIDLIKKILPKSEKEKTQINTIENKDRLIKTEIDSLKIN